MSAYAQTFSPERLPPDRQDSRRWNVPGFAVPGEAARSDTRSVPREAARLDNRSATVARAVGRDHNVAPLEAEFLGHGRPKRVERSVRYAGERPSALSFIFQFRSIVFRFHGSVLPCILIEVCISVGLSFAALYYTPDETFTTGMHGVVGMLLAFLIGIRTQIAWGEYSAGAGHVGGIICAARGITAEALGALIVSRETRQAGSLPAEATELARLLKLYYYCCVEHLRSSDGHEAWEYSHRVAHSFASSAEVAFFDGEFGKPQPGIERRMVQPSTTTPVPLTWDAPGALKRWDSKWDLRDTLEGHAKQSITPAIVRLDNRWRHSEQFTRERSFTQGSERYCPHDPSRAKPLLVLVWVRELVGRISERCDEHGLDLNQMSNRVHDLSSHFSGVCKIDTTVLPLPYCQLLKLLLMGYVFSLPFVLAHDMGWMLPPGMALIAIGLFGLDQVGAELEAPFGVDTNDFPLMSMGIELADDLDIMCRGAEHSLRRAHAQTAPPHTSAYHHGSYTRSAPITARPTSSPPQHIASPPQRTSPPASRMPPTEQRHATELASVRMASPSYYM